MTVDRDCILTLARYSIGDGPLSDAERERVGGLPGQEWCGQWILWIYHLAGVTGAKWVTGCSLPKTMLNVAVTHSPKPGDFGIIRRKQHHVLVDSVEWLPLGPVVHTIAGNTGPAPGIVDRANYKLHDPNVTWFSIEQYLEPGSSEPTYLEAG